MGVSLPSCDVPASSHYARDSKSLNMCHRLKEDHGQPLYCVSFNFWSAVDTDVFAACGANRVSYRACSRFIVKPFVSEVSLDLF
jgi:hypothetical protein